MIKKYSILILITFFINNSLNSAGTNSDDQDPTWKRGNEDLSHMKGKNSNFKRGVDALNQAKKYDKKGKTDKSIKRFKDSLKFFELANEENPNEPDILNLLGFTSRKVGDYTMAEIYYEQGLELNPLHNGINEYLGELYVQTNRIDKAKERLEVLKNCNCEEFNELDAMIKKGSSKN